MQRPRFLGSQSAVISSHESGASQPEPAALLQDIDAGLATVEATLSDLEHEAAQYRQRLEGVSGAARLFDVAGLESEATAMHDGEQTIADALAENERQRAEMIETAEKLHAARAQLAPARVDIIAQLAAAAARRELTRESQADSETIAERAAPQNNQDTVRVASPPGSAQSPAIASRSPIAPTPIAVSASDPQERQRNLLVIMGGTFLLVLLAGGTLLAAVMFGGGDDDGGDNDSSSRAVIPAAAATDAQSQLGVSTQVASATPSAVATLIEPSPTSSELPAIVSSPTPPMPTSTVPPTPTTIAPQATPTPSIPSTEAPATPTVVELGTVVDRVIDAESTLRSGQIDASIEYADGTRSTALIGFDIGMPGDVAKVAFTTTYLSGAQTRTTEQIMIGDQVWERIDGGSWQEVSNIEGGWGQVQVFLPGIGSVAEPQRASDDRPGELHWYDPIRNADVFLQVDSESGVPAQMRQVSRDSGNVLTVTYTSWNSPVQIEPPVT